MPDAKNKAADEIILTALRKDARLTSTTRARINRILKTYPRDQWLAEIAHVLGDEAASFANTLRKIMEGGYVVGAAQVANKLPDAVEPGQSDITAHVPFEPIPIEKPHAHEGIDPQPHTTYIDMPRMKAAVESINSKAVMHRMDYDLLEDDAKRKAFTIAGVAEVETIEAVRDALATAVNEGLTLKQTQELIGETVNDSQLGPAKTEAVFRTTVQASYADGLDAMLDHPTVGAFFPFMKVNPVGDSRLTELCASVATGGIEGGPYYLKNDPVYRKYRAPRHWQCRCSDVPASVKTAAEDGLKYAQEWLERGRQPLGGFVSGAGLEPLPKGWVPGGTNL